MRISLFVCMLSVTAVLSVSQLSAADDLSMARADARRELAIAKAEARYYWQVDYPQQQRDLNDAIELTEAEIKVTRQQLYQYEPFEHFSIGQPLYMPIQGMRVCLLEAEMRLDRLRHQRNALIRFHTDQGYLLDQRVAEARARLVELEGGEVIEIGPVR